MRFVMIVMSFAIGAASCSGGADPGPAVQHGPQANGAAEKTQQAKAGDLRGLPAGAIHVEPAVIVDATGFEAPMAASTLFLPRGWQTQGGVLWGREFACTNGYNYNWSAASPDGSSSVSILPQMRWEMNNYNAPPSTPGCQAAPYTNVRQYLDSVLQQWRPGARPLDYRQRKDIEQQFAQLNNATPTAMGEMRTWVEAGEIEFAFEQAGADMRGSVAALVVFSLTRTNAMSGMPPMEALTGFALPGYAVTAPNGRFDRGFFEAIRRSVKSNPQWESRIAGHNAAIGRVALEESRKRSAIVAKSNAEIARIRDDAWNAQQESSDRRAREFGEVIRGVETYDDANAAGGQVELSGHYDHAWRLNDGSYVLTNDPNFEPWRDLGVEGATLKPTR